MVVRSWSPAQTHDITTTRRWTPTARRTRATARVGTLVSVDAEWRRWRAGRRLATGAPGARAERDSDEIVRAGARFGQGHEASGGCPATARMDAKLTRCATHVATSERTCFTGTRLRIRGGILWCDIERLPGIVAHRASVDDAARARIVVARSARLRAAGRRTARSATRNDRRQKHEGAAPPQRPNWPSHGQGAHRPVTTPSHPCPHVNDDAQPSCGL
jgi:hypothetical protein